ARAQSAQTRVPVGDILELFNNRSQDYSLVATDEAAIRSHQQVAEAFLKLGVLDSPTNVRPLWNRSFDAALRAHPSA
ncbi:MAG TPA: ABC transporter substrate-binding protein, partial [Burkholderiaceae bacterium]